MPYRLGKNERSQLPGQTLDPEPPGKGIFQVRERENGSNVFSFLDGRGGQRLGRIYILGFSLVFQGLAGFQYFLIQSSLVYGLRFAWQFYSLLGLSLLLSVGIYIFPKTTVYGLMAKILCLFLMGYPLGLTLWPEFSLATAILLEGGLYLPPFRNLIFMIFLCGVFTLFQNPNNAFHSVVDVPETYEILSYLLYLLLISLLLFLYSRKVEQNQTRNAIILRQDEAVARMAKANLGYQSYSSSLALDTLKEERNRVSREIHDTVGYSLTNIRIMLEAASLMVDSDPNHVRELLVKSMNEAGKCLEEVRDAMGLLRSQELPRAKGIRAFFELVVAFGEATGIRVSVAFGNSPNSFGERIDKAIFRFIQEGLTNSFRHGRATEIRIYFWVREGPLLTVKIQDNGSGTVDLTEGIGLAGMKERLNELNGRLRYNNSYGGFAITMEIPLGGKDDDSIVAGG